jgi:type IV pilus assembly protein PilF
MWLKLALLIMAYLITGCSYFKDGIPTTAIYQKKSIKERSNKEKAKTLTELGVAYYQQGKYKYASENLERALELDAESELTYQTLALIQIRKSHPEKARHFFLEAMELAPKNMDILTNYAVFLYGNNEKDAALLAFKKVINSPFYSNKCTAFTYLGLYDLKNKRQRAAEINFYYALRTNPNYALALIHMAKIRYAQAKMMAARGFVERYFSYAGQIKPLEGLILAIKIERSMGDTNRVAEYQLELMHNYPFSSATKQIKNNQMVN